MLITNLPDKHPLQAGNDLTPKQLQDQAQKIIKYQGNAETLLPLKEGQSISRARLHLFAAYSSEARISANLPAVAKASDEAFNALTKLFYPEAELSEQDRDAIEAIEEDFIKEQKLTKDTEKSILQAVQQVSTSALINKMPFLLQRVLEKGSFYLFKEILSNLIARDAAEIFLLQEVKSKDCLAVALERRGSNVASDPDLGRDACSLIQDLFLTDDEKTSLREKSEADEGKNFNFRQVAILIEKNPGTSIDLEPIRRKYGISLSIPKDSVSPKPEDVKPAPQSPDRMESADDAQGELEWTKILNELKAGSVSQDSFNKLEKIINANPKNSLFEKRTGEQVVVIPLSKLPTSIVVSTYTPLQLAALKGNKEFVQVLLAAKVDPDAKVDLASNSRKVKTLRDIIKITMRPEDQAEIEKSLALNQVARYLEERFSLGDYKRNLGFFNKFMFNRKDKLAAATALQTFMTDKKPIPYEHKGALSQGKLGKIVASISKHHQEVIYEDKPKPSPKSK